MVQVALKCPHCGSEYVGKNGHSFNKQRYICKEVGCGKTFYDEYQYNGCKPDVKRAIIVWSVNGTGTRATARGLSISKDTVTSVLKKRKIS
jgi:transposase-like protein